MLDLIWIKTYPQFLHNISSRFTQKVSITDEFRRKHDDLQTIILAIVQSNFCPVLPSIFK